MTRLGRRDDRTRMVVGFAFSPGAFSPGSKTRRVALIAKNREPDGADMKGTLNGIGGKVKARESYKRAMVREFHQETGAVVGGWDLFAIIEGDTWRLFAFVVECDPDEWREIQTLNESPTDEMVVKVGVRRVLTDDARGLDKNDPDRVFYSDVPALVHLALTTELYEARAVHFDRRAL